MRRREGVRFFSRVWGLGVNGCEFGAEMLRSLGIRVRVVKAQG